MRSSEGRTERVNSNTGGGVNGIACVLTDGLAPQLSGSTWLQDKGERL